MILMIQKKICRQIFSIEELETKLVQKPRYNFTAVKNWKIM